MKIIVQNEEAGEERGVDIIALPKLEKIQLSELPRLVGICKSMNSVEVEGGGNTSSTTLSHKLFSSNTILWFPNLAELYVEKCELLEVVFDLEGLKVIEKRQPIVALSKLRSLELRKLDGMAHVWKNIPRGFQGFQNLILIDISKCHNLKSLLPAYVAKLLVQLQSIKIMDCPLMENVIQREDEAGDERIEDVTMSFSSKAHAFEWPSIKKITLGSCPKLKTFYLEIESRMKQKKIDVPEPSVGSSSIQSRDSVGLFNHCLEFSCVPGRSAKRSQGDNSSLEGNKYDINKEVTKQEEPNHVSETENQTKMCSLLNPYNLIESLENLEELSAAECDSLEVIFELDEGLRDLEESNYIFNNLTVLRLVALPKLLHIWKKGPRDIKGFNKLRLLEVSECNSLKCLFTPSIAKFLVKLEKLIAFGCDSLEVIFELEGLHDLEESNYIFNNLIELKLSRLPKLLHIWKKGPRDVKGFKNLRLLRVVECNSLKCLFTPSIAKLLVKLEEITVRSCNEMEEILAKESGDEEKRDHVIAFPQVKTLDLEDLPKLECFCNEAIAFEWPSLENMKMGGCEKLKMFVPTTSMKTPKLLGVRYKEPQSMKTPELPYPLRFQPMIEGDLTITIQHIMKGKVNLQEISQSSRSP